MLKAGGGTFTQTAGLTRPFGQLVATTVNIAGGTLEFDGGSISATTVNFTAANGTLALAAGMGSPAIGGFVVGETLDFLGATADAGEPEL